MKSDMWIMSLTFLIFQQIPLLIFTVVVATAPVHHFLCGEDTNCAKEAACDTDRSLLFAKKTTICRRRRNNPYKFFTREVYRDKIEPDDLLGECKKNCDKLCPDSFCDLENNQCLSLCTGTICPPGEDCVCSCQDPPLTRVLTWAKPISKKKVEMCEVSQGKFKTIKVKKEEVNKLKIQGVLKGPCEDNCDTLCPGDQLCDVAGLGQCVASAPAQCTGVSNCPGNKVCNCECITPSP